MKEQAEQLYKELKSLLRKHNASVDLNQFNPHYFNKRDIRELDYHRIEFRIKGSNYYISFPVFFDDKCEGDIINIDLHGNVKLFKED